MIQTFSRRRIAAGLASLVLLSVALPTAPQAAERRAGAFTTGETGGTVKPAKKKFDPGLCTPGSDTFDIDKCYEEVKN